MSAQDIEIAKLWIQIAQFVGTVIVAVFAVVIAWRQANTARHKLQFDLYEKRFEIYDAAVKMVFSIGASDPIDETERLKEQFTSLQRHAIFLLPDDLNEYLRQLSIDMMVFLHRLRELESFGDVGGLIVTANSSDLIKDVQETRITIQRHFKLLMDQFQSVLDFRKLI